VEESLNTLAHHDCFWFVEEIGFYRVPEIPIHEQPEYVCVGTWYKKVLLNKSELFKLKCKVVNVQ
jgi:hypothetical protein